MKFLDENDKDVRWFLKTFPWVMVGFSVFIGYILFDTLFSQSVKMRDGYSPIDFEIKALSQETNPVFFFLIAGLESVMFLFCVVYIVYRLKTRHRLKNEDKNTPEPE